MQIYLIAEPRQIEDEKRSICFESFSSAKKFSKELLEDAYEISEIVIKAEFLQGAGEQPNVEVVGGNIIYVDFNYNAHEPHDKDLLLKLLKKYEKSIIH